ncbi:hypothetical protein V8F06_007986 [Rhypophila decipiens]
MAEAVAALGLAANIFQFLEYGSKFVGVAWKIYKSGPGSVEAFATLQSLSRNIQGVIDQFQPIDPRSGHPSPSEQAIFDAATDCLQEARRILASIDSLGFGDGSTRAFGAKRRRDKAKTAFKLIWNDSDIKALEAKFESLKTQLMLNLAASLRVHAMETLDKQNEILGRLVDSRTVDDGLKELRFSSGPVEDANKNKGFLSTAVDYIAGASLPVEQIGYFRECVLYAATALVQKETAGASLDVDSNLEISPARRSMIQRRLLTELRYDSIEDRAETVAEAHETTLGWVFETGHAWDSLREWLESDHQLYWVTGKPGSGKSTLMKYISQPLDGQEGGETSHDQSKPRCMQYLEKWAGDHKLTTASFYFWTAGNKIQTSKEGLYRTLLYRLLDSHPEAIEHTFPQHWESQSLFDRGCDPILVTELKRGFQRAISFLTTIIKTKVCLFIDGLDEFGGDHEELVQLLKGLLTEQSNGYLKICVSSRPWVIFEEAFIYKPNLRLEDLTFNDIRHYVTARFGAQRTASHLLTTEPEFGTSLIKEIVEKASGVFLWANLVVTSLLDGIKLGDRISDLRQRLDRLPPDLEDLYTRILDNLDPSYLKHAAQYFSLMEAYVDEHEELPSVLFFSFADEEPEMNDDHRSQTLADRRIDETSVPFRIETMGRRLNSRSKGLIEVAKVVSESPHTSHVQYLHRTLKDYIQKPTVQTRLNEALEGDFDPYLRFCYASLRLCKLESVRDLPVLDPTDVAQCMELSNSFFRCLRYSRNIIGASVPIMVSLLDELENFLPDMSQAQLVAIRMICTEFTPAHAGDDFPGMFSRIASSSKEANKDVSFLNIAINMAACEYLKVHIARRAPAQTIQPSESKARPTWRRLLKMPTTPSHHHTSPHHPREHLSRMLADAIPAWSSTTPLIPVIKLFLQSGADVNAPCELQMFSSTGASGVNNNNNDNSNNLGTTKKKMVTMSVWVRTLAVVIWKLGRPRATDSLSEDQEEWLEVVKMMLSGQGSSAAAADVSSVKPIDEAIVYIRDFTLWENLEKDGDIDDRISTRFDGKLRKEMLRRLRNYVKYKEELDLGFLSGLIRTGRREVGLWAEIKHVRGI